MKSDKNNGISRRTFLVGVSIGVSAGVVSAACNSNSSQKKQPPSGNVDPIEAQDPKAAASALCLILGPWTKNDTELAHDFLGRFLTDKRMADFSKHAAAIATLPATLPTRGAGRLDKIPLDTLSAPEREACLHVLGSLYAVSEVRFYVAGEPNAGICMTDLSFIAKKPT
tara:strand:- start:95370 stop:95876 length:507 start_codon:yes stop_codon:yes gene_type:complete